jgi:hypothetical protein
VSDEQDEIRCIVAQLKRLQMQESELMRRLELLTEADDQPPSAALPRTTRDFGIGDLVQTNNPRPFPSKQGTVTRTGVGADRITVQTKNGSKIVRASFDLTHAD